MFLTNNFIQIPNTSLVVFYNVWNCLRKFELNLTHGQTWAMIRIQIYDLSGSHDKNWHGHDQGRRNRG